MHSKHTLRNFSDRLLTHDPGAVAFCVSFVVSDNAHVGDGRARALMARRLKHCQLTVAQRHMLLEKILHRLESGSFSEQFKDQLRLALHLDAHALMHVAKAILSHKVQFRDHVFRYALWIMQQHSAFSHFPSSLPDGQQPASHHS